MKTGKKIAVLSAVFLIAAVVYFMWPMGRTEENGEQITYTAMEEATLPLVYPKMEEITLAPLLGHREKKVMSSGKIRRLSLSADITLSRCPNNGASVISPIFGYTRGSVASSIAV